MQKSPMLCQKLGRYVYSGKAPFTTVSFTDSGKAIEYAAGDFQWKTDLSATQRKTRSGATPE